MVLKPLLNFIVKHLASRNRITRYDAYLVGYYGMQNSGDDALFLAAVMGAKNELKANNILVSAASKHLPILDGVKINHIEQQSRFKGQKRLAHYRGAYRSKCVIFGGGSVFHTAQDIELKRQMMALTTGEHNIAVGVSLGPFVDEEAKKQCQHFLKECAFVGVRDQESLLIAQQLAPEANVKLTFDLAPLLTLSPSYPAQCEQDQGILINLCPVPKNANGQVDQEQQQSLLDKMQVLVTELWAQYQQPITLVSLNGHSKFGDDGVIHQLMKRCGNDIELKFLPYQPNPLSMIGLIRRYKVFISMRLHGCVFGYLAKTPVVALTYHTKCQQWCEQIGVAHEHRFDAQTFNPKQLVQALIRGLDYGFSSPALALNDAVKLSLLNWRAKS